MMEVLYVVARPRHRIRKSPYPLETITNIDIICIMRHIHFYYILYIPTCGRIKICFESDYIYIYIHLNLLHMQTSYVVLKSMESQPQVANSVVGYIKITDSFMKRDFDMNMLAPLIRHLVVKEWIANREKHNRVIALSPSDVRALTRMRTKRPTQPSALTTISDMGNVCFKIRAESLIGGVEIRASFHFA